MPIRPLSVQSDAIAMAQMKVENRFMILFYRPDLSQDLVINDRPVRL